MNPVDPANAGPELDFQAWLQHRFLNLEHHPTRYEASLYGPLNGVLTHYFPLDRQFLVKPQPKLRPAFDPNDVSISSIGVETSFVEEDPDEDLDDPVLQLSFDSDGGDVLPRAMGGGEGGVPVPDFFVAKATHFLTNDQTLLIVEVKPGEDPVTRTDKEQLLEYMELYSLNHQDIPSTMGLLVHGVFVRIFTWSGPDTINEADHVLGINSREFKQILQRIATDNWAIYQAPN
ncbi:hypothetical protein BJ138DRAFT_1183439 [Hygrophoropsis aurantiaca]|uniref:Uncharacterized protein n=1 Tax=Hygrophoropsis aurantiaca TaxID=72124 RepID=A0ACB7ZYQ8_9AGAM|nr:hypothetical protein BJ138DRAFT_1183439 [Hygrophoropsis aurantiaca]